MPVCQETAIVLGYIFSAAGISSSPHKVDAVKATQDPTSLLGTIQYCGRFIPSLATISAPPSAHSHRKMLNGIDLFFQLRTSLNGIDFNVGSYGLWSEKQNILLQNMHKKEFELLSYRKRGTAYYIQYGTFSFIPLWPLIYIDN